MTSRLGRMTSKSRSRGLIGIVALFVLSLAGCTLRPQLIDGSPPHDPSLLTGERVFGEPVPLDEAPILPIRDASDAMLAYVDEVIPDSPSHVRRFRALFEALTRDGYFDAVYTANRTLTAGETFEARGGNCLSYTNMFVALARAAGLSAHYQIVDTPATWDADAGFLIRYTHINVLVEGVRIDRNPGRDVIVDFNDIHPEPDYPREIVEDNYAESLFYANRSVQLMRQERYRESFAYLRRALSIDPDNVDLWINLGAFYARVQDYNSAIEAYDVALVLDPRNKAAYSGLSRSHTGLGNHELAQAYEERVRNYRERNPYYHYALAQVAFGKHDYPSSLEYINSAISLRRDTARFHLLKGLVEERLGHPDAARESYRQAQRYGLERRVKLDLLRSLARATPS